MIVKKEDMSEDTLKQLWAVHIEILDEVVRICEKNNLKYYLAEGTLLGAVRHKAHIPWDDDMDIAMPREDLLKFTEICKTELDEKYFFQSTDTFENHYLPFAKVRKKDTEICEYNIRNLSVPKGIYIDIFPLDNFKKESFGFKIRTRIIKTIAFPITAKLGIEHKNSFGHKIVLFVLKPFSIKSLSKFRDKLMAYDNKHKTDYYVNFASYYNVQRQIFKKSDYGFGTKLEFSGRLYSVPVNYHEVLTRTYGDYMQLPPVEERVQKHKPEYIDFGDENSNFY